MHVQVLSCAGVVVGVACTQQVSWAPVHMQMCSLWHAFVYTSTHICEYILHRICKVCSLALGGEGLGFQLVYAGHLLLAWGLIFDRSNCLESSLFWCQWEIGVYVCVRVHMYTHTHSHTTRGVFGRTTASLEVGTRHLESPNNPKSQDTYMPYICTKEILMYICTLGSRMKSRLIAFFPCNISFLPNKKRKHGNAVPKPRIQLDVCK